MGISRATRGAVLAAAAALVLVAAAVAGLYLARADGGAKENEPPVITAAHGVNLSNERDDANGTESTTPAQLQAAATTVSQQAYEAALAETVACMSAAGVNAALEPGVGLRRGRIAFSAPTLEEAEAARGTLEECRATHSGAVEAAWQAEHAGSPEVNATTARAFATCMREAGIAGVGDSVSAEQQRTWFGTRGTKGWGEAEHAAAQAAVRCVLTVEERTGFRP